MASRLVAILLALLTLAGCHQQGALPTPPSAQGPNDFPLIITHRYGYTALQSPPTRVVTLGWNDQDIVQALGVKPVGVRSALPTYPTYPWVLPDVANPPVVSGQNLDFDAVAAAKPDVIFAIGADIDQPTYDRLTKIAPTIVSEQRLDKADTPWYTQTFTIARALGKTDQARELSDDVGARFNQVRRSHEYWVNKIAVVDWLPEGGGHYLLPLHDPRRSVFDGLGFLTQRNFGPVNGADLPAKADDDLLVVVGATEQEAASMSGFPLMRAVTEHRTIYIPSGGPLASALEMGGPRARVYALDRLTPLLEAALKAPAPKN